MHRQIKLHLICVQNKTAGLWLTSFGVAETKVIH